MTVWLYPFLVRILMERAVTVWVESLGDAFSVGCNYTVIKYQT